MKFILTLSLLPLLFTNFQDCYWGGVDVELSMLENEITTNPLKIMEIHPTATGINGGRFGCSRNNGKKPHRGLDLKADHVEFKSIYSGVVQEIDERPDHGKLITIKSEQKSVSIKYIHLSEVKEGLKKGDSVKQGQVLGVTGKTGIADSPHLHIEVSPTMSFSDKCRLDRVDPENHIEADFGDNTNKALKYCNCHLTGCETEDCK